MLIKVPLDCSKIENETIRNLIEMIQIEVDIEIEETNEEYILIDDNVMNKNPKFGTVPVSILKKEIK